MMKPRSLKAGDTIGIIAPASPPVLEHIKKAKVIYEQMGLKVVIAPTVGKRYGYLGGEDSERVFDLEAMFLNPEIKGIFCACGGYGTPRIVDQIDYDMIKKNPKIFWGYSDITCLHTAIYQETGLITFHGPMMSSDLASVDVDFLTHSGLKQVLSPQVLIMDEANQPLTCLEGGTARGRLVGGNLTLLTGLIGTPYEIETKGALLFIEEIEEEPYRIDRMLNQLRLAGKLDDASGFVIGNFNGCDPKKRKESLSLQDVLQGYLKYPRKPCVSGFRIGHCMPAFSVPYGAEAVLDGNQKKLTIESGVKE